MSDRDTAGRLRALVLAVLVAVSVLSVPLGVVENASAAGNTITVNSDGSADYTTIQAAVDNASAGDTIQVEPGTYEGENTYDAQVLVDEPDLTIRGDAGDATPGPGPDAPYLNGTLGPGFNLTANADGTTIVGIDGDGINVDASTGTINSEGRHLDGVTVRQSNLTSVGGRIETEGKTSSYTDIEVRGNVLGYVGFSTNTETGSQYNLSGITIAENQISEAVTISSTSPTTVQGLTVADNTMTGLDISLAGESKSVDGVSVRRNAIGDRGTEGMHLDLSGVAGSTYANVTVANNTLEMAGTVDRGMLFQLHDAQASTYDVGIVDNVVNESQSEGLLVETRRNASSTGPTMTAAVSGNEFHNNGDSAIRFTGYKTDGIAAAFEVRQNAFVGNGYGITNNVTGEVVDARDNYWGSADGPSSRSGGPLEDPVSGALADGSGQSVSENSTNAGVSNVRFDPFLTSPPGSTAAANVAVTVDATNSPVTEGETLTVDATVENTGGQQASQSVTLSTAGTQRDATSVTLDPGASTTVTLSWATVDGDAGSYDAVVASEDTNDATGVTVESASGSGSGGTQQVDGCTVIDSPGAYELSGNITNGTADECIHITSSDVVFDGYGHTIDGTGTGGTAISVEPSAGTISNVTVRDIDVTSWLKGVEAADATVNVQGLFTVSGVDRSRIRNTDIAISARDSNIDVSLMNVQRTELSGVQLYNSTANISFTRTNRTGARNAEEGPAIALDDGSTATIGSTEIGNSSGVGVNVSEGSVATLGGVTIDEPELEGIRSGGTVHIDDTTVTNPESALLPSPGVVSTGTATISNSTFVNAKVETTGQSTVTHTTIRNTGLDALGNTTVDNVTARHGSITAAGTTTVENSTVNGSQFSIGIDTRAGATTTLVNTRVLNTTGDGIYVDGGNATLRGVRVLNASGIGVTARDGASVTVDGTTIRNVSADDGSVASDPGHGIQASDSTVTISDSTIRNTAANGVNLSVSGSASVADTDIGNVSTGIHSYGGVLSVTDGTTVTNASILGIVSEGPLTASNVTVDSTTYDGIVATDEATIDDTLVTGTNGGIVVSQQGSATVENVTVRDTARSGIYLLKGSTASIDGAEITNPDVSGVRVKNGSVTVRSSNVTNGRYGISVERAGSATIENVTLRGSRESGVFLDTESTATIERSRIVGTADGPGIDIRANVSATVRTSHVTNTPVGIATVSDADVGNVQVRFTNLTGNAVAIRNDNRSVSLDAANNYFGGACAAPTIEGPVTIRPMLHGPERAGPAATGSGGGASQEFEYCLELDAGETYAVGFPGPSKHNLSTTFYEFEGAVYLYNETSQSWELADGDETPGALEAVVVVPTTDTRAFVEFADASPARPTERQLGSEGWHLVAPRQYANAESGFSTRTVGLTDLLHVYEPPSNQPKAGDAFTTYRFTGDRNGGPTVSPFTGYFVYVDEPGTVPATVPAGITVDDVGAALNATVGPQTEGPA